MRYLKSVTNIRISNNVNVGKNKYETLFVCFKLIEIS